jgi:hypothetical protein
VVGLAAGVLLLVALLLWGMGLLPALREQGLYLGPVGVLCLLKLAVLYVVLLANGFAGGVYGPEGFAARSLPPETGRRLPEG